MADYIVVATPQRLFLDSELSDKDRDSLYYDSCNEIVKQINRHVDGVCNARVEIDTSDKEEDMRGVLKWIRRTLKASHGSERVIDEIDWVLEDK